jgi:hypothetical protein
MFPIDVYKRVFVCKSGMRQELRAGGETLKFVGIGRIGDIKGRIAKRFIQNYERAAIRELLKTQDDFDILITHDKDDVSQRGYGMAEIRDVLDSIPFQYHFYGHTGESFKSEMSFNGVTQDIKIKELEFDDDGRLPEGCMLILEKTNKLTLEIVGRDVMDKLSKDNWNLL